MRRRFRLCTLGATLALGCGGSGSADSVAAGGSGGNAGQGGSGGASADASAGAAGSAGTTGGSAGVDAGSCVTTPQATSTVDPKSTPLSIIGDPPAARGIFDPDVEYPVGAAQGVMAYSAVLATNSISTRIAVSSDQGASWTYVANANTSGPLSIPVVSTSTRCPGGTCNGQWTHEVSSLIQDADDPDANRRWKLFTHSYLVLPGDVLAYDLGHIALHVAKDPAGPWTTEGAALGWDSESPISSSGASANVSKFAQLKDCVALTEPSAQWRNGGIIDLAVGCATAANTIRIELFRSLDHAKTFLYTARLVQAKDALCLGGTSPQVNAADLFRAGGKSYVSVSVPGPNFLGFTGYRGCHILELTSGGDGLARDSLGAPIVARKIDATDNRFIGACSAADGATAMGYLVSMLPNDTLPPVFRVFTSPAPLP